MACDSLVLTDRVLKSQVAGEREVIPDAALSHFFVVGMRAAGGGGDGGGGR